MAFTINTMLIDLDGCLITPKLTRSVPSKIAQYAVKYLGYDVGSASMKCREEYRKNGTNLEGFVRHGHVVDPEHYHTFIHASLPYTHHLNDQANVRRILDALPADKYIFTNADKKHTLRCLELTGLSDCFKGIIDFEKLQEMYDGPFIACKPKTASIEIALKYAEADALTTLFFDDQPRNVHMAMDNGVRSVLVGDDDPTCAYYEHVPSLENLETKLFSSYFK